MTIEYSVEAFDKNEGFLVFDVVIPREKLNSVLEIMQLNESETNNFLIGLGGFDLTVEQVRSIERILSKHFFREDLDFQISGGEI